MRIVKVIFLLLVFPSAGLWGDVLFVDDSNVSGPWLGTGNDPYQLIQDGIDAAFDGDTVLVLPGTYVENLDFLWKKIVLRSDLDGDSMTEDPSPEETWIDGNKTGSVVIFQGLQGAETKLEGFTIYNGSGRILGSDTIGGGIYCHDYTSPVIRNNIISGNSANLGGGIYCQNGSPRIEGNVVKGNSVGDEESGGGICCYDGACPVITGNEIKNNYGGYGGGVRCLDSDPQEISGNYIHHNIAYWNGGGINCNNSLPSIENNTVESNVAHHGTGGGIHCFLSSVSITDNAIMGNKVSYGDSSCGGGGVFAKECAPTVSGNVIQNNEVLNSPGGGIKLVGCAGSSLIIENNLILHNKSPLCTGGGIRCESSSPLIRNNLIGYNSVDNGGGGIHITESFPVLLNNFFFKNKAGYGGAIRCRDNSFAVVTNNTLIGNTASDGYGSGDGGGICLSDSSEMTVTNTILWDNTAETAALEISVFGAASTLNISYSDVEGGQASTIIDPNCFLNWGAGMIDSNPQFVDPDGDDYHILYTSPCKDVGDNSALELPYTDFEGDPRIDSYDGFAGITDMGADEFFIHMYYTGESTPGGNVELKVTGKPWTYPVYLWVGLGVLEPPFKTGWGEWWNLWSIDFSSPCAGPFPMGMIPSTGVLIIPGTLDSAFPSPLDLYLQVLMGDQPNLTNLCTMYVE